MKRSPYLFIVSLLSLALSMVACNLSGAGSSPVVTAPPGETSDMPATGVSYISIPSDPSTIAAAVKDEVFPSNYGDNLQVNQYERPFQLDNTYRPDADIIWTFLSDDGDWYYFSTQIVGSNPATATLDAPYGIEIDINRNGRGEFLLWASPPYSTTWTKDNIQIFYDTNNDVGGPQPLLLDAPGFHGDGYDTLQFDRGSGPDPDAAWVRQAPLDPTYLEMAVKKSAIGYSAFLWNAWTDFDLADPAQFDYNDYYTAEQAGSPYAADPNFPLKALYGMDNTCRVAYGFTPVGDEPGLCSGDVTSIPTSDSSGGNTGVPVLVHGPTLTPTRPSGGQQPGGGQPGGGQPGGGVTATPPPPSGGSISGQIFIDNNINGVFDPGETATNSYSIELFHNGDCSGAPYGSYVTTPEGTFTINNLYPSTWCVRVYVPGYTVLPGNSQSGAVPAGGTLYLNYAVQPPG